MKKQEPRKARGVRLSDKEWNAVEKAAKKAGLRPSEWVRGQLRRTTGLDA